MKNQWKVIVMLSLFILTLMASSFPMAQVAEAKGGSGIRIALKASAQYPSAKAKAKFKDAGIVAIVVLNKCDLAPPTPETVAFLNESGVPFTVVSTLNGAGMADLRETILRAAPEEFVNAPSLLADLISAGHVVMLVVPVDMEAPKGRLILPQSQTIREALDLDAVAVIVKERELKSALELMRKPPALVVTDSQAFLKVAADVPPEVPLTSFSILMARAKGDLGEFVRGARAVETLKPGDRVLICEACTHHPIGEDIGTVKIPRWLTQYVGGKLEFGFTRGHDFPDDLESYRLAIHCGGCMLNRREMLSRVLRCRRAGVPVTNYGVVIAYTLGTFNRALRPFPGVIA